MAYLEPTDYPNYGLPAGTTADWITAATALINSFCRRPDLNIVQYTERLRVISGARTVMLTYLPLAPLAPATSPLVSIRGALRESPAWRGAVGAAGGDRGSVWDSGAMGGRSIPAWWMWTRNTGELTLPWNVFGLPYNEVQVTYTAGLATIGDDVKSACAQIVRNAQATPALNASRTKMDTMWIQYFSSSLLDETVQAWLAPYVANRLG